MRKPARPWISNARCQERNSSSDSWYQRQASSRVISPLRTAATTAALRRATHLFVVGGGSPSEGNLRFGDSLERMSTGRDGRTSHDGGPSIVDPWRAIVPSPLSPPGSTGLSFRERQFPFLSRFFNALGRSCH